MTHTLSITNYGSSPASNVSVADTLPGSLLSPSASATITISANALVSLSHTASVSGTETEPNARNNVARANASMYFQFDLFLPLMRR